MQTGLEEVCIKQLCPLEVGLNKVSPMENGLLKDSIGEISFNEVCPSKIGLSDCLLYTSPSPRD